MKAVEFLFEAQFQFRCPYQKIVEFQCESSSCACSLTLKREGMRCENLAEKKTSPEQATETWKRGLHMSAKNKVCVIIVQDWIVTWGISRFRMGYKQSSIGNLIMFTMEFYDFHTGFFCLHMEPLLLLRGSAIRFVWKNRKFQIGVLEGSPGNLTM